MSRLKKRTNASFYLINFCPCYTLILCRQILVLLCGSTIPIAFFFLLFLIGVTAATDRLRILNWRSDDLFLFLLGGRLFLLMGFGFRSFLFLFFFMELLMVVIFWLSFTFIVGLFRSICKRPINLGCKKYITWPKKDVSFYRAHIFLQTYMISKMRKVCNGKNPLELCGFDPWV